MRSLIVHYEDLGLKKPLNQLSNQSADNFTLNTNKDNERNGTTETYCKKRKKI